MPVIYFFAGAVAMLLSLVIGEAMNRPKRKSLTWTQIQNIRWAWDFEYAIDTKMTAQDIARLVALCAVRQVEREREARVLGDVTILPGAYSIRMGMTAAFVKREEPR